MSDDLLYQNTTLIFKKRLVARGFLVSDLIPQIAPRFFSEIPALLAQGKLKSQENIVDGIENGAKAFVDMLKDSTAVGKPVIRVAKDYQG